jgi:transposase
MATPSGSSAHSQLILPKNTSELHSLVNAMRAHDNQLHGFLAELAAHLRKELPAEIERRGGTRRGFGGLDGKLSARQVAHPFAQLARIYQESSSLYVIGFTRYQHRVLNIQPSAKTGGGFNADL